MTATDFVITNPREGKLSDIERSRALYAAADALARGETFDYAEYAACEAAFSQWASWPESATLICEEVY